MPVIKFSLSQLGRNVLVGEVNCGVKKSPERICPRGECPGKYPMLLSGIHGGAINSEWVRGSFLSISHPPLVRLPLHCQTGFLTFQMVSNRNS